MCAGEQTHTPLFLCILVRLTHFLKEQQLYALYQEYLVVQGFLVFDYFT